MGTRAAAAKPKVAAPSPAPVQPLAAPVQPLAAPVQTLAGLGELLEALQQAPQLAPAPAALPALPSLAGLGPEATLEQLRAALVSDIGAARADVVERQFAEQHAPQGVREIVAATWECGWEGKLSVAFVALGAATAIIAICEIVGRLFDVPFLQFGSKISGAILGD